MARHKLGRKTSYAGLARRSASRRQAIHRIRRNPSENDQKFPLYVVVRSQEYEGPRYIAIYDNEFDAIDDFLSYPEDASYSFDSTWILGPVNFGDNIIRKFFDDGVDDIDKWSAANRNRMAALRKLRELESR